MGKGLILIVDDEKLVRYSLSEGLRKLGYRTRECTSGEEALDEVKRELPSLVILDLKLPGISGMDTLARMKDYYPDLPVVMLTAYADVSSAVEAMRLGAYDYLNKPFIIDEFKIVVEKALETSRLRLKESDFIARQRRQYTFDHIIGESRAMKEVKKLVMKVARNNLSTVFLQGETGTGKDLIAQVLHYESSRFDQPFVAINSPSLADTLFESELFGHEKGAFTDAKATKKGLIELADGGTVFLNEIGDLKPNAQVNLLHILEEKKFRRVGGITDVDVDVRIVAATNRDLKRLVEDGSFREDLYYRLNVIPIHLPPLRERKGDEILLARHFLRELSASFGKPIERFSPETEKMISEYHWPGNVRELRNVIERAVLLCESEVIDKKDFPLEVGPRARKIGGNGHDGDFRLPPEGISIDEVEKQLIIQALERTSWNQTRAAEALGIGRDALRYRMKKFNLLKKD
jgi:DNA-binding NtrC family response regulator